MAFGVIPYAPCRCEGFWTPSYSAAGQPGPADPLRSPYRASRRRRARRAPKLGSRFDQIVPMMDGNLGLFGRLAWAHDSQSNTSITPAFLGLPTPSFIINGATTPRDKALLTAGAEWRPRQAWSLTGKFDGEFASGSTTYAGRPRTTRW